MANTSPDDVKALQAEVARLQKELSESRDKVTAVEASALAAAKAQLLQSDVMEVPTGKMIEVEMAKNGRDASKGMQKLSVPLYFYKIDLPPSGGTEIKINGMDFYHGTTYEVDLYTLRSLKDIVARSWGHEANIRGTNENAYRSPTNRTLRGGARVH